MSHFTVLVISNSQDDVEKLLAPFQENNMGDCPKEYLAFTDKEDKYRSDYETDTVTRYRNAAGELFEGNEDCFYRVGTPEELEEYNRLGWMNAGERFPRCRTRGMMGGKIQGLDVHVGFDGYEQVEVPISQIYPTFEQYMEDYCGYRARDPETNRYGYWENPNRKWDWYQVGGRWSGMLRAKQGAEAAVGSPGLMGSRYSDEGVDQLRKGDLDTAAMLAEAKRQLGEQWDEAKRGYLDSRGEVTDDSVLAHLPEAFDAALARWNTLVEELKAKAKEAGKPLYELIGAHPEASALRRALGWQGQNIDAASRDEHVAGAVAFSTFAVLTEDGKWYEKGEMGWWACVSNEKAAEEWSAEFQKLIDATPDDRWLTVVDCHI